LKKLFLIASIIFLILFSISFESSYAQYVGERPTLEEEIERQQERIKQVKKYQNEFPECKQPNFCFTPITWNSIIFSFTDSTFYFFLLPFLIIGSLITIVIFKKSKSNPNDSKKKSLQRKTTSRLWSIN